MQRRLVRIESSELARRSAGLSDEVVHEIVDESLFGFCLLAFDGLAAVGGLMVERTPHQPPTWWLHNVYVTPARRRSGICTELCIHVGRLANVEGVQRVRASVQSDNTVALAAYKRLGFSDVTAVAASERQDPSGDPVTNGRLSRPRITLRVLQGPNAPRRGPLT